MADDGPSRTAITPIRRKECVKRQLATMLIVGLCASCGAPGPARQPESQRRVLAIAALESKEILGGPRLAEIATDFLQDILVQSRKFNVVERRNLGRVIEESENPGKLLGADFVVYGAVVEAVLGTAEDQTRSQRVAEVMIQARVVGCETGKTLYSSEKRGLAQGPPPAHASNPERIAYDAALMNRAARDAVEKLAAEIAALAP